MTGDEVLSTNEYAAMLPVWSLTDVRVASREALDWLDGFGFSQHGLTRFHVYRARILSEITGPLDVGARRLVQEATVGILMLFYMSRAWFGDNTGPVDRVHDMLKGRPGDWAAEDSKPWDAQFELFCYSMIQLSGVVGLVFAEPDLVLTAGPLQFGLPVKRVTSDKSGALKARLRSAIRQLERQRLNGVALIEAAWPTLDLVLDPSRSLEQSMDICRAAIDDSGKKSFLDGVVLVHFRPTWIRVGPNDMIGGWSLQTNTYFRQIRDQDHGLVASGAANLGRRIIDSLTREHQSLRLRSGSR